MARIFAVLLSSNFGWADALGVLLAIALIVAVRLSLPEGGRKLSRAPTLLLFAHIVTFAFDRVMPVNAEPRRLFGPLAVLLLLLAIGRCLVLLVLDVALGRRLSQPLPRIIREILQGLVYMAIGIATLRAAGVEPGSLLTTSALFTAVIGLSLQETLGNMFAGLAIQMQRPFEVGDWIAFDGEAKNIGRVVEINWRATKVITLDDVEVIVPNASLAKAPIKNFTKPTKAARRSVYVFASYETPPMEVHAIILRAVADAPFVLSDPAPSVVTNQFGEYGIEYWVRFFTDRFDRRDGIDGGVRDRIWYAFRRAGVEIPYPHRTIELHEVTEATEARQAERLFDAREKALRCVDLFQVLPSGDHRRLAEMAVQRAYAPGEVIVRQGEATTELFIIERGEVVVTVRGTGEADEEHEVARLGPGKFFGEMALLTGDSRRATVRANVACELLEVGREALQGILERTPELADQISTVLAARKAALGLHTPIRDEPMEHEVHSQKEQLLERIRKFFSL